jgi:hypothetical protein
MRCSIWRLESPRQYAPAAWSSLKCFTFRYRLVVPQLLQALQLERIVLEPLLSAAAVHLLPHEGVVRLGHLPHLPLDGLEVVGGEGPGHLEVVVEAVLDRRAEADLRLREQLPNRGCQHVRRRMAQHLQRRRVLFGEDLQRRVLPDGPAEVPYVPVHPCRHRGTRQARPDRLGHGTCRGSGGLGPNRSVGQRDLDVVRHGWGS